MEPKGIEHYCYFIFKNMSFFQCSVYTTSPIFASKLLCVFTLHLLVLNSRNQYFSQQKSHPAFDVVIKEGFIIYFFAGICCSKLILDKVNNVNKYAAPKIVPNRRS